MVHAEPPHDPSESALSISCDDWSVSLSFLGGGMALRFRELIIVFECELRKPSQKMPSIAEPPTSSASTLAGHRATVVQTPTASPIVAAVPRGVVTTHCRSWGLSHSRCQARWPLYEPRRLLDRAWRDSPPRATSGDTEYQWSCLSDPLGSIRRTLF